MGASWQGCVHPLRVSAEFNRHRVTFDCAICPWLLERQVAEGYKFSGLVPDLQHTPASGERAASWQAVAAAHAAGLRSLRLLCGNEAIVLRSGAGLEGSWDGDCLAFSDTSILWVPSQGKHEGWQPPLDWPDASQCISGLMRLRELLRR